MAIGLSVTQWALCANNIVKYLLAMTQSRIASRGTLFLSFQTVYRADIGGPISILIKLMHCSGRGVDIGKCEWQGMPSLVTNPIRKAFSRRVFLGSHINLWLWTGLSLASSSHTARTFRNCQHEL